ncbi:hypothetical protein Tco_0271643 [Tanacetum coccineum]
MSLQEDSMLRMVELVGSGNVLWYVVPTGRIVVPTGRYVVPAGKHGNQSKGYMEYSQSWFGRNADPRDEKVLCEASQAMRMKILTSQFLELLPSSWSAVSTVLSKKMSYAYSPNYSSSNYNAPSNSKTGSHRSGNVIEDVLQSFVADTKPEQQLAYEDFGTDRKNGSGRRWT